jgi:CsoR family transcriptional regulator, copper-sensing transcriptional repressor
MQTDKKQILNRLATIEGHLKGIRKMVEADQYCVDILHQSRPSSVR